MKNPHDIVVRPHITEKSVGLSYGDDRGTLQRLQREAKKSDDKKKGDVKVTEADIVRKYTFIVAKTANKIEIKSAIEAIYNEGKKADDAISVTSVRTIKVLGKKRRRGQKTGYEPDRKKAIVTLKQGQMLEDYGV
ncbi:MAG: 50S ribosomal protein L23 [Fimbriimonas sp.]